MYFFSLSAFATKNQGGKTTKNEGNHDNGETPESEAPGQRKSHEEREVKWDVGLSKIPTVIRLWNFR